MLPEVRSFITCTVLSCFCVQGFAYNLGSIGPWLHRKDDIKRLPIEAQRALLKETLKQENVELTGDVPQSLDNDIPDIVENLVNGAIDIFLGSFPGVSQLLGPIIKGGISLLKIIFGGRKVYIRNLPPIITCPVSRTVIAEKRRNSAVVTWQEPVGYDAEDGTITNVIRSGHQAPGYKFSGDTYIKYNVADSKGRTGWCSFSITVVVIKCPPTPLESHRTNTCPSYTRYGETCTFSCSTGYTLVGKPTLTCTRTTQYNWQAPMCKITTCQEPKLPIGVVRWTCSDHHNYRSVCTIECAPGFTLDRDFDPAPKEQASMTCKADGQWTRLPICKDVTQPEITNCPGFAFASIYADRGKHTARVNWGDIQAKDGNVTQVKGQKSGSLFTEGAHEVSYIAVDNAGLKDTCTFFVNVHVLRCPVPVLTDKKVKVDCNNQISYGSACSLTCQQGFTLQGSRRLTCEKHGDVMEWEYPDGDPTCLVTATTTEQPTTPGQNVCSPGSVSFNGQKTPGDCTPCSLGFYQPDFGQRCCFVCKTGFTTWFPGASSLADCVDETWSRPSTTTDTPHGMPCPPGSISPTGFEPGCKKCPIYQEPDAENKSCQWCSYTPSSGFQCSSR